MSKKRILFVDDEPLVIDGLRRMLHFLSDKWDMEFVASGQDALQAMELEPFDVVVTDMRMPGMNGAQLLKQTSLRYPGTVRFILSGHSDQELIIQSVGYAHRYLSKPCDSQLLQSAIENSIALRVSLSSEELHNKIAKIQALPTPSAIYNKLVAELQSELSSIKKIGEIIGGDIGLTAKLLHIVNSSFFGVPRHIENPHQAVSLLGLDTVKAVVLTTGMFDQFQIVGQGGMTVESIYTHCIAVGTTSQKIAKAMKLTRNLVDDALLAGMLHDLGKLVMLSYFRSEYDQAIQLASKMTLQVEVAEREILGVSHAEIGAHLMSLWGLPDTIIEAVAYHHRPGECVNQGLSVLAAVHIANALEHEQESQTIYAKSAPDLEYLDRLGISDRVSELRELCSVETTIKEEL